MNWVIHVELAGAVCYQRSLDARRHLRAKNEASLKSGPHVLRQPHRTIDSGRELAICEDALHIMLEQQFDILIEDKTL